MTTALLQQRQPPANKSVASLAPLIDSIGGDSFGPTLAHVLYSLCGAEHFVAFRLGEDDLRTVFAGGVQPSRPAGEVVERYVDDELWRTDAAMSAVRRSASAVAPVFIHAGVRDRAISDLFYRVDLPVSDRVLLCGPGSGGSFGLCAVLRASHGTFSSGAICNLTNITTLLAALLAKHAAVVRRNRAVQSLATLPAIERRIAATRDLPRREGEVCARVLYGMSSAGIAVDMDVSEQTVKTYRKRTYQRLSVGSERELLNWYLTREPSSEEWRLDS